MRRALVNRMDGLLTSAALRAEAIGGQHSWRLGRWTHTIVTGVQEAVLGRSHRWGWTAVDPDLVEKARAAGPQEMPRYPSFFRSSGKVSKRAEELFDGVCLFDDGTAVQIEALSWLRHRFRDGYQQVLFHALHWVTELIDAYALTARAEYLDRATALTRRWISQCLYAERSAHVWYDHAAGLRAVSLCRLWVTCCATEPPGSPFMRDLLSAIVRHAEKLAHESFYHPEHDHGMAQAYALLAVGLLIPAHPKAGEWMQLGRSRLEAQMAENVSPEGLHREHSPYYHFYVFRVFYYAARLAHAHGVSFSRTHTERLQAMITCGAHFLKPNGTLPAIGDTSKTSPVLFEERELREWPAELVKEYLYSSTRGAEGEPPDARSVLLPGGGCAFLRSGWGTTERFEDERFLVARLSTFKTAHIHPDVFSFELYAYGDDLIVDSGGPFAYGDPIRKEFFQSTAAHNTVVVDDANQRVGEARVLHWSTSDECDLLDAEHRNAPDVTHRRAIVFIRPAYFIVLDRLSSGRPHRYSQLFHLNPTLHVALNGLAVSTDNYAKGPTVQIVPLLDENLGLRLHRGALSPRQGWVCSGEHRTTPNTREMTPNTVVDYQRSGATAVFAVLIVAEPPGRSTPVWGRIEGTPFLEETRIEVVAGERHDEIVLATTGTVTLKRT